MTPILAGRLAASAIAFVATGAAALAGCLPEQADLRGPWGSARFSVEVVDTPETRARGLMFREDLATSAGMLFVYETPGPASFWMKNTLLPLDMIFLGEDGVVRHVHSDAIPGDLSPIAGGTDILVVLEINAGLAEAMGIAPGSEMRHPAFGPDAAWPCE